MVEKRIAAILLDHTSLQSDTVELFIDKHVKRCLSVPHIDEAEALKKVTRMIVEDCGVSDDSIREACIEHFIDDIRVDDDEVREACVESKLENLYIDDDEITREITEHFADDITIDKDAVTEGVTEELKEKLKPQLDAYVAEVRDGYFTSPEMTGKLLEAIAERVVFLILSGQGADEIILVDRIVEDTSKGIQQVMVDAFAAGRRAKAIALSYDASAEAANEAANAASKAAKGAQSALKG